MRPGFKTTEFWVTVSSQVIALLAIFGVVNAQDQATLGDSVSKAATGLGVFLANAWIVVSDPARADPGAHGSLA